MRIKASALAVGLAITGWGPLLANGQDRGLSECSHPIFDTIRLRAGDEPYSVIIQDLNSDGAPDLAVVNPTSDSISVLLNLEDGVDHSYAAGDRPISIASADLDNDGVPDLAVANFNSDDVSVLLGNGDGTFAEQVTYQAGDGAYSLSIGDLNGDGAPDVAVANQLGNQISVLLGTGDGSFSPGPVFASGALPSSIVVADLSGDGVLDLAVANQLDDNVAVFLGNGNGTFGSPATYEVGQPLSVASADLNGDGALDLAVASYSSGSVAVFLGNGDGGFPESVSYPAGDGSSSVAIGDLNGDGAADLAVANSISNDVSVFIADGNGDFLAPVNTVVWNPPQNFNDPRIWWVSVEDLDGDGALDLAVASHDAWVASPSVRLDGVLVFFGIGDGTFRNRVTYSVGPHPRSLAVADVDLDGALDLVLGGHDVSVLLGTGDGTFAGLSNFGGAIESVLSVAVANLNADDAPDIVVGDNSGAWVFLNNGDGTFAGQVSYGTGGSSVAIADLNADGVPDLALSGGGVAVLLGNGDGTFADEEIYGTGLWSVVIADLNSDDAPDLAVGNIAGVLVLLGNGDGTFADEVAYAAGHSGTHLAIADFNNDGALDLAVASAAHDAVSVLLGSGDGTFFMDMSYAAGDGPRALASTDFNRDGNADLAVAYSTGSASGDVLVFLGNGDGSLAEPVAYGGAGLEPFAVAIADFNGDNGPDLAIANSSTNNLHVVLSTCPCGNGLIDPGEECDGDPCCNVGCTFKTVSTAPCSDGDQDFDGIRDDNCAFWQCIDGVCLEAATVFADIGGSNGNCIPDGAADGNDRFHALNCFANQSTLGTAGYPCELSPPAALHADAGGPFGACCPDGVCDGNDAFHALHGFAGDSPCQCPANFVCPCPVPSAGVCLGNKLQACTSDRDCGGGSCQLVLCQPGPAPISPGEGGPQIVAAATLRLESSQDKIRAGETVDVVVTLGNALADLRGYQLHVVAVGGDAGSLDLVDLSIEARKDHVFAGLPDWRAFNVSTQQVLAGIDASGVEAPQGAYLATLVFRASEDAAGTFTIDLLHDDSQPAQRTFLFPTPAGAKIQVQETSPAVVTVQALRSRTSRTP